jgi:hypothetical protein
VSLRICSRDTIHLLSEFETWRRGQESNLPRLLRTDNGFEDREGHQAPFTLRKKKENVERTTPDAELKAKKNLLKFLDLADDLIEVRPIAGIEFGMEQFSIGMDFECAAGRRNQSQRFDSFAELENFGRQTDGLRRVVSNDAIFDRDFGLHATLLSAKMVRKRSAPVNRRPFTISI